MTSIVHNLQNHFANAIESPEHQELRINAEELLDKARVVSTVLLVSSIALCVFGVLIWGVPGALLCISGILSGILSYDALTTSNNMIELLREPRNWFFLGNREAQENQLKDKILEAFNGTLFLKPIARPLLDAIIDNYRDQIDSLLDFS